MLDEILIKKYKIIIFDWDGTAVTDRNQDATQLINTSAKLLNKGLILAVITGTHFENINNQYARFLQNKQNLFICTNRGSEVFGFDKNDNKTQLFDRKATKTENELLDKIALKFKNAVESTSNANIELIFNKKNRRKIDLLPEWEDPKKSEIKELLQITEKKLESKGFAGGLNKAFSLLKETAKSYGFNEAKITSDIKHLEIGITDKSDSMKWLYDNVIQLNKITDSEILILGDEFGEVGGFLGSDSKMILKNKPDITYISVGIEPNGVLPPVKLLSGGPETFLKILNFINEI